MMLDSLRTIAVFFVLMAAFLFFLPTEKGYTSQYQNDHTRLLQSAFDFAKTLNVKTPLVTCDQIDTDHNGYATCEVTGSNFEGSIFIECSPSLLLPRECREVVR